MCNNSIKKFVDEGLVRDTRARYKGDKLPRDKKLLIMDVGSKNLSTENKVK